MLYSPLQMQLSLPRWPKGSYPRSMHRKYSDPEYRFSWQQMMCGMQQLLALILYDVVENLRSEWVWYDESEWVWYDEVWCTVIIVNLENSSCPVQ